MVARAPGQGGRIVTGGVAPDLPGAYYRPTLIADVGEDSEVYRDEVFGPVLTVRAFTDDDDALRQANDTVYGLAASAWTRDVYRAQRASREIHAGCVWINDHIPIISEMPHGGVGASGFGKDMSDYSLRGVPDHQARDERHHRGRRKGLAPDDFHQARLNSAAVTRRAVSRSPVPRRPPGCGHAVEPRKIRLRRGEPAGPDDE